MSCSIFIMIIMATLLFWQFRLAIAFVGIGVLMGTNVLTLPMFIRECKIDVILFLFGMMVTVGVLKELGLFTMDNSKRNHYSAYHGQNFRDNHFRTRRVYGLCR
jgi:Na+/H+ antiporter NhaD/arsenite permease-like protein